MNSHIIVYGSWFAFAIIAYLIIINLFGFIWAFRINSKNRSISIPLVTINAVLGVFSFAINIMIIVLYALYGKNYLEMQNTVQKSIQTLYTFVFAFGVIFMFVWMVYVIMFSNNFLIIFTDDKIYLFGLSIINSAIVKIQKQNKWVYFLEYVYKKDGSLTYTEKCRFWIFSNSTTFLVKNYLKFIDLNRNNAFFKIDQVLKATTKTEKAKPKPTKNESVKTTKKTK